MSPYHERALLAALALLAATPAVHAEEEKPHALILTGVLGVARFQQGEQGPPLCCRERESWSVLGAELGFGFGYQVLEWLEPGAEISVGYLRGTDDSTPDRRLEIAMTTMGFAPRIGFRFGDPLFVAPRLAWHFKNVSADFEGTEGSTSFDTSKQDLFMGPGLGVGVGYRVVPTLAIGLDAEAAFVSASADLSNTLRIGAGVTWLL